MKRKLLVAGVLILVGAVGVGYSKYDTKPLIIKPESEYANYTMQASPALQTLIQAVQGELGADIKVKSDYRNYTTQTSSSPEAVEVTVEEAIDGVGIAIEMHDMSTTISIDDYQEHRLQGSPYEDAFEVLGKGLDIPELVADIDNMMAQKPEEAASSQKRDYYYINVQKLYEPSNVEVGIRKDIEYEEASYDISIEIQHDTIVQEPLRTMHDEVQGSAYCVDRLVAKGDTYKILYRDILPRYDDINYVGEQVIEEVPECNVQLIWQDGQVKEVIFFYEAYGYETELLLQQQIDMIQRATEQLGMPVEDQKRVVDLLQQAENRSIGEKTIRTDAYDLALSVFHEGESHIKDGERRTYQQTYKRLAITRAE